MFVERFFLVFYNSLSICVVPVKLSGVLFMPKHYYSGRKQISKEAYELGSATEGCLGSIILLIFNPILGILSLLFGSGKSKKNRRR